MGHYLIEKLNKNICNLLYNLTCSLSNYFNIHTLFKVDNLFFPSRSTILKVAKIQKLNKPQKSQTETGRLFVWSKTSPNWTMELNHCGSVQSEASSHAFVCQRRCWAALRQSVRDSGAAVTLHVTWQQSHELFCEQNRLFGSIYTLTGPKGRYI